MKKIYVMCAAALLAAASAQAEKGTLFLYGPDYFQVTAVSPNGKWACGLVGDGTSIIQGLVWNLTTGETTYLSSTDESMVYDVNDAGQVVGNYTDYTISGNGMPINVAGIYDANTGEWTPLDNSSMTDVSLSGGTAMAISNDGHVVVGAMYVNGTYRPVKWVDGVLAEILESTEGCAYTVSDDGTLIGGWSMETAIGQYGPTNNRGAVYWDENGVKHVVDDAVSHLHAVQKISPDNSKMLCTAWGNSFIYDVATDTKTELPWYSQDCWNQYFYYIGNDGLVLGGESSQDWTTGAMTFYGYVYDNGTAYDMTDWLATKGAVVDESKIILARGMDMTPDGNTIVAMTYVYENGMLTGKHSSVAILLDREITYAEPVALKGEKLMGLNKVLLSWKEPLTNAGNVLGYNVYRDGVKITTDPIGDMNYVDEVTDGTYSYTVSAIYEGESDLVESAQSAACEVVVAPEGVNEVNNVTWRTMGYDNLLIKWDKPLSNLPTATYYDAATTLSAFGGGQVSFEAAIRIDNYAAYYAGDYKIARVDFMPWNVNAHYELRVYENQVLTYSQAIPDEGLTYREMNSIDLTTPYTLSPTAVTYVVIAVDASELDVEDFNAIGVNYGTCTPGYSDLVRQIVEPDFYSLDESAAAAGVTGGMPVSWAISAVLAQVDGAGVPDLSCDVVENYDIYCNGAYVTTTTDLQYIEKAVAEGNYQYSVVTRYANGALSTGALVDVDLEHNERALAKAKDVVVESEVGFVKATWSAPLDNDETLLSYSTDTPGDPVSASSGTDLVELTIASDFEYTLIAPYDGYKISGARFYPIAEALFTVVLEVNGEDVDVVSVGELGTDGGYQLNQWNTVYFNQPVELVKGYLYRLKVICSEVDPSVMPISLDNGMGYAGVSDLYSSDYSNFQTITNGGISGSWMIGIVVNNDSTEPAVIDGYNVSIDGRQVNSEVITDTTYTRNASYTEGSTHRLRVDVVYPSYGNVEGDNVYFTVSPAAVHGITVDRVKVYPNPAASFIRVSGDMDKAQLFDMQGRLVATSVAADIDVTSLPVGTYLLKVFTAGEEQTVKVLIAR